MANQKVRILAKKTFATQETKGKRRFLEKLQATIEQQRALARAKGLTPVGVGVGCAGLIDNQSGAVCSAPNIPWLSNVPLQKLLQNQLQNPVLVANDVQCGVYAEHQLGAARGYRHVLAVFFGTGVGGALILNDQLFLGAYGLGGQVGCLLANSSLHPRDAQIDGILDRIVGKALLFGAALGLASKNWAPDLHKRVGTDLAGIEWHVLAKSIQAGDQLLENLLRSRLRTAGAVLSNVINFIGPEVVVLGGGLAEELPLLLIKEIQAGLRAHLVPEISQHLRIVTAKLRNQAVALGAAKLALEAVQSLPIE